MHWDSSKGDIVGTISSIMFSPFLTLQTCFLKDLRSTLKVVKSNIVYNIEFRSRAAEKSLVIQKSYLGG